jgi:CheY-like chemotaxis protein
MTVPHVLVVDDDPDMVDVIGVILGAEGYTFRTAANGLEALDSISGERPALVLLDMLMPVMNGWQCAEELHHRYGHTVPIVVLTAAEHAEARAREIDADGVLSKPFEIEDLLRIVARYCGHPPSRVQVVHRTA